MEVTGCKGTENADILSATAENIYDTMPAPVFSSSLVLPRCCVHINLKWLGCLELFLLQTDFFIILNNFYTTGYLTIVFQRFQEN